MQSRRDFLRFAASGLVIAACTISKGPRIWAAPTGPQNIAPPFWPSAWIQITPDNILTIMVNKSEMGQGVSTSLPMIVAEEMDADWEMVRFEFAPAREKYADPVLGRQMTGGSTSVRNMYGMLRHAGAAAREMLIAAAARSWNVPVNACETYKSTVRLVKFSKVLSYGELAEQAARMPVPEKPRLRTSSRLRILGTSPRRLDIPAKLDGSALYGADVYVQGMVYAMVARPPSFGATPIQYDRAAAGKSRGVVGVYPIDSGIAVCATGAQDAFEGRRALGVRWSRGIQPGLSNRNIERVLLRRLVDPGVTVHSLGDADERLSRPQCIKVRSTYILPYLAHATMEPVNCTAYVHDGRCDLWVSTQDQTAAVQAACTATGLRPEQVNLYTTFLGGGSGRRLETDFIKEAVVLSKAAARPVKLLWTREEDMQHDFYRPASCTRIQGAIDEHGRISAWSQRIVSPSPSVRILPGNIANGIDPCVVEGAYENGYAVPNYRLGYIRVDLPIPVGICRSGGHSQNAFARECFIDELAHASGIDPLKLRLDHLRNQPRAYGVLNLLAEKVGWGTKPPAGTGRGVAQHSAFGSYAACVAEVTVDEKKGFVRVHRVVCAVDCGLAVSPGIIESLVEGGVIVGLSAAMKEHLEINNGGVVSSNFSDYSILRMSEAPEVEVHLVKAGDEPGGASDISIPPVAPSVANAIFAATGARIHRLPMSPANVLKALRTVRHRTEA